LNINGQVQGLGFRPYVFRLAHDLGLCGTVANTRAGVEILIEGRRATEFVRALKEAPPRLSRIAGIRVTKVKPTGLTSFTITGSAANESIQTNAIDVLPDLACCPECLQDIAGKDNRRYSYPFTNCTQCGPRYSIIQALPYDRPRTTMKSFRMCPQCQAEYDNPADRRFHAQPNCCPVCGPRLSLLHANGEIFDQDNAIGTAIKLLLDGKILAIKSLGGFHLACDALNAAAIVELRKRKNRPDKPLALMCADIESVRQFCVVDADAKLLLEDIASPVVLLPRTKKTTAGWDIPEAVAPGLDKLGVMLAYAPLHHLLFKPLNPTQSLRALVMTSANPKDEPVISELPELISRLGPVIDYILFNDRPIAHRCDDSVLLPTSHKPQATSHQRPSASHQPPTTSNNLIIRRSRGYAPQPVLLDPKRFKLKPVLACGGELKNTFALATGNKVYMSPHIGDMGNASSMEFFEHTLDTYKRWFNVKPEIVACDLHPDMLATRFAENLSLKSHRPLVRVQHHHAHIASVIAEHNLPEPVLGIALDGTGLGTDEKVWGCEFLLAKLRSFERVGHLRYLPLVGGEAAIFEPLRIAAAYLVYLFGASALSRVPALADNKTVVPQLHLEENTVFTSSTGRLFDAVSALTGICARASYDGQAPAMLESAAEQKDKLSYFTQDALRFDSAGMLILDPTDWLKRIVDDVSSGVSAKKVSRRFHTTFIQALAAAAKPLAKAGRTRTICLSGGSFQNRILLAGLWQELTKAGFKVYTNRAIPVNDGGISFGQAVVADACNRRVSR
jgi:hydrogenase maturation protein HypF